MKQREAEAIDAAIVGVLVIQAAGYGAGHALFGEGLLLAAVLSLFLLALAALPNN